MPRSRPEPDATDFEVTVRRIHRRDLNRTWEFLKLCFRDVNRETVEYQRPRRRRRFIEVYDEEDVEQLLFEVGDRIVGYAECAFEITAAATTGSTCATSRSATCARSSWRSWPSHPDYHGRGVGAFMLEQLQHLARVRGCTHLVLEVAENNEDALRFYRKRNFYKLDAAIFLARKIETERELLPPRRIGDRARTPPAATVVPVSGAEAPKAAAPPARSRRPAPRPGRR